MSKAKQTTPAVPNTPPETATTAEATSAAAAAPPQTPPASEPPSEPLRAAAPAAAAEAPAAPAPAPEPPAEPPRVAAPDAACADQVRAFLEDWNADRPAEAAAGSYGATARDRWAEQGFDAVPDGVVLAAGWSFAFQGGRFIGAQTLDQLPPLFIDGGGLAVPLAATA